MSYSYELEKIKRELKNNFGEIEIKKEKIYSYQTNLEYEIIAIIDNKLFEIAIIKYKDVKTNKAKYTLIINNIEISSLTDFNDTLTNIIVYIDHKLAQ